MSRLALLLAAPLALAACETMPELEAPPANAYTPLSIPDRVYQSEDQVIDYYLARANTGGAR